jgi:ribosomal protein L7/L12
VFFRDTYTIAKLKEAKDLVDLGMMSKEDFEKLKAELTPLIIKK